MGRFATQLCAAPHLHSPSRAEEENAQKRYLSFGRFGMEGKSRRNHHRENSDHILYARPPPPGPIIMNEPASHAPTRTMTANDLSRPRLGAALKVPIGGNWETSARVMEY